MMLEYTRELKPLLQMLHDGYLREVELPARLERRCRVYLQNGLEARRRAVLAVSNGHCSRAERHSSFRVIPEELQRPPLLFVCRSGLELCPLVVHLL